MIDDAPTTPAIETFVAQSTQKFSRVTYEGLTDWERARLVGAVILRRHRLHRTTDRLNALKDARCADRKRRKNENPEPIENTDGRRVSYAPLLLLHAMVQLARCREHCSGLVLRLNREAIAAAAGVPRNSTYEAFRDLAVIGAIRSPNMQDDFEILMPPEHPDEQSDTEANLDGWRALDGSPQGDDSPTPLQNPHLARASHQARGSHQGKEGQLDGWRARSDELEDWRARSPSDTPFSDKKQGRAPATKAEGVSGVGVVGVAFKRATPEAGGEPAETEAPMSAARQEAVKLLVKQGVPAKSAPSILTDPQVKIADHLLCDVILKLIPRVRPANPGGWWRTALRNHDAYGPDPVVDRIEEHASRPAPPRLDFYESEGRELVQAMDEQRLRNTYDALYEIYHQAGNKAALEALQAIEDEELQSDAGFWRAVGRNKSALGLNAPAERIVR